jgi:hypothetical protein
MDSLIFRERLWRLSIANAEEDILTLQMIMT